MSCREDVYEEFVLLGLGYNASNIIIIKESKECASEKHPDCFITNTNSVVGLNNRKKMVKMSMERHIEAIESTIPTTGVNPKEQLIRVLKSYLHNVDNAVDEEAINLLIEEFKKQIHPLSQAFM